MLKILATALVGSLAAVHSADFNASSPDFDIWCIGNCETDATGIATTPGTVLMGGSVGIYKFMYCTKSIYNLLMCSIMLGWLLKPIW
jgi:hypothetical protein